MVLNREQRRARDRAISIALAWVIGVIIGVGGWLWWYRDHQGEPAIEEVAANTQAKDSAVRLDPHKALYRVEMVRARNGSQIINIQGQMFFQIHRGCEGYNSDHRFTLTYDYADSPPMRVTSDFSTIESYDGDTFDFSSRRWRDGELYQELRGQATLTAPKPRATFTDPEGLEFILPETTLFPAQHTEALIAAAKAGKKWLNLTIFDGSDDQGPVDVTAIITPIENPPVKAGAKSALDPSLLAGQAWRIRMAFFPQSVQSETPDYELTMILHDNGVISRMNIDYQDFTIEQALQALAAMPPDPCPTTGEAQATKPPTRKSDVDKPLLDLPLR